MRVEPARPGALVQVNGEALFCKDLVHGDEITLGSHRLRWLLDATSVAAAPPGLVTLVLRRVDAPAVQHQRVGHGRSV